MTLGDVDIEPEGRGIIMGSILGHQAVLTLVDVRYKLNYGFKFKHGCHDKNREDLSGTAQMARGVTIQVVLFE